MSMRSLTSGSECSEEGWDKASIRIADITTAIVCEDPDLKLQVEETTKKFLVDEAHPDVRVLVARGDEIEESGAEKIFDSGAVWQLYRQNGNYLFRFTSSFFGLLPYKVAFFEPDFTYGEVRLHSGYFSARQPVDPLEYPLGELLILNLLARGRGVEVHALGMVDSDGNGHLFVGQSGAGKSTLARLCQNVEGLEILNDDRVILRNVGQKLWMYGTPWHGEAPWTSPVRAPLARICFLRHGGSNLMVPLRRTDAVGRLFACSFPLFYCPEALEFTLGFFEEVVRAVPCFELRFLDDERVVKFIHTSHG